MDPSAIQPPAADAGTIIQFIVLIILVLLSGFFSSAETALTTVNRIRMRALEEEGNRRAATVNKILDRYSKMLSAILIGNNIVNLSASALATTLALKISLPVGIATAILTIVVLICGEIVPKTWAMVSNEKLALAPDLRADPVSHTTDLHCGQAGSGCDEGSAH